MRKQFTFKKSDLERTYIDPTGCPIFTAMKRVGIPVTTVGPKGWSADGLYGDIKFTPSLLIASSIIAQAYKSRDRVRLDRKAALAGRSFKVTF